MSILRALTLVLLLIGLGTPSLSVAARASGPPQCANIPSAAKHAFARAVQLALIGKGAALTVTSRIDHQTRVALRAFQTTASLPVTGQPDAATIAALGVAPC